MNDSCPQISHLAGCTATVNGMGSSLTEPCLRRRLKRQTLFTVEKRELRYPNAILPELTLRSNFPSGTFGVVRTDTQALLGVVINNTKSCRTFALRMAEFIREEVDMDCVIVLSDGAVCFTATLRGAETDIVPGDTVKRHVVGYLGHDGKTGCGAKFTNIRVVCQNTLTAALGESGAHSSITPRMVLTTSMLLSIALT